MVKSKNYGFEVKILQKACEDQTKGEITNASYEPLREMVSPLGIYVVATPNQEFIIELKGPDSHVYGAKLWIDEQEIYYKKTFKARGFFMGFKLGEGRFNSFKFAPPSFENKDPAAIPLTRSEIKVVFYKVQDRYVSDDKLFQKSIRKAQDVYIPGVVKENKKFFRKSLTVQAGEVIYKPGLDKRELFDKKRDRKSRRYLDHVIDYDSILDTIVIHYGDFNSLLVQGVVSLANYDHLNVIPINEIRRKPKIVERLLMTIVRKFSSKGLMLQQIEEEFGKITRQSFEDLEVGPLVSFISLRNELFQVDENNYLRCSETAKNIYLDLRDVDPKSGIIPPVYFQTGFETNLKKNDELYGKFNSFRQEKMGSNEKSSSKGSLPVMIDLTQD